VLFGNTPDKGNMSVSSSYQSGLVGHWALDNESYNSATNRTTDKTPYSNHGTNYGANFTTDRMGHSNSAMYFDGVNDYVNLSSSNFNGGKDVISVSLWINQITLHQHSLFILIIMLRA